MKKNSILMLIAASILVAGILVAGCTTNSSSASSQTDANTASTPVQTGTSIATPADHVSPTSTNQTMNDGNRPQFNQSAAPAGTPPEGMMNGTFPSGTPPAGGEMNRTSPSGTPPSGTPPAGA